MGEKRLEADWLEGVELGGSDGGPRIRRRTVGAFLVGLVVIAIGFYLEHFRQMQMPVFERLEPVDWLLAVSLLEIGLFLVVPLARNPAVTREYWQRLRNHRFGVLSLVVVTVFFLVGLVGPMFVSEPTTLSLFSKYQPPVFASTDTQWVIRCTGEVANGKCHGTWKYPLGTTSTGKDVFPMVILGARTALSISLITATLLVPIGVVVGLVSAYVGGRVDDFLMRIAEILQTVPAIIIYLLFWRWTAEYRLLLLIVVFGLVNWGGMARMVRNEALTLRDRPFVKAARSAGAGRWEVIRDHLLPNLSRSIITNVTLQLPLLVLTEAALSFVPLPAAGASSGATLGDPTVVSWGQTIYLGVRYTGLTPGWWVATFPSIALVFVVLSLNLFGQSVSDVLDPGAER